MRLSHYMEALENSEIDRLFAEQIDHHAPEPLKQFLCRLMAHSRQGHLCLKSQERISLDQIAEGTDELLPTAPIIHDKGRYYLQRNWVLESTIILQLRRLLAAHPSLTVDAKALTIPHLLNARQADAVRHTMGHSLTVVTGGPGTGKTFTAGHAIQVLMQSTISRLRVKIAAPTGKAADRLAQSITASDRLEIESLTLHRLLSLQPGRSRLFEKRQILADLIVVDEASMIDASLFAHLLAAIPSGSRLLLLGDSDQLPPVDGGGVFADLAEMIAIHLDECHRTKDENIQNIYQAARIGNVNPLYTILEPFPSNFIDWAEPMLEPLRFSDRPSSEALFERFDRLRLICPLRKGPCGVDAMNTVILRRQQQMLSLGQWWAAPIILTNNDSSLQLYNGSPGIVIGRYRGGTIPHGDEEAVLSDGRSFLLNQLPGYEIAFALSVHKSQGSEYEQVVCCLPPGSEEFAREALYTAITRAKRSVRLVGDRATLEAMIVARSRQENGLLDRMSFLNYP
jgi:exodeoxyribonuclease V alpha subunit